MWVGEVPRRVTGVGGHSPSWERDGEVGTEGPLTHRHVAPVLAPPGDGLLWQLQRMGRHKNPQLRNKTRP